jgi:acyl-coenzyme A synthetase/AMP-(fatty) acid ligase
VNFWTDVVTAAPADRRALVELARDGSRREWTFGEVAEGAARVAGALHAAGVRRGDTVLTLIGNRPEWVLAMVACFRQGYVVLPCNEQLRPKDLRLRLDACPPALVVADGAPGLWKAVRELWPLADQQRCTVHALRNVTAKLPERHHREVKARWWNVFDDAASPAEARRGLEAIVAEVLTKPFSIADLRATVTRVLAR